MTQPAGVATRDQPALGATLREERLKQGLSLRELSRRLGVSASLVSQIETGKVQPSVRTLYSMVSELGISLDRVFGNVVHDASSNGSRPESGSRVEGAEGESSRHIQRKRQRCGLDLEGGVRWERLTTSNEPTIEFLYLTYPPGSESAPANALVRHAGKEYGLVVSGRLKVTSGFNDYTLEAGDSVWLESSIPHRLFNDGGEPVEAVWVVLGRE
ncbi:MAG: cupin domain-containing protein [Gaiellaceae bacterium]